MFHNKKNILFIGHDASRTGAPIVLLNFLNWLKNENRYKIFIFLKHGGAMENDFRNIGETHIYVPINGPLVQRIYNRLTSRTSPVRHYPLPSVLLKQKFDLVYLNTVVCIDMAPYLKKTFNCPVICHVHENNFTIQYYYQEYIKKNNLQNIDHFIAVSNGIRNNLAEHYGITPQKISLVHAFISVKTIMRHSQSKDEIRKELSLTDEFIVGGSGVTIWRKGVDLFVQLASTLNELRPNNNVKLVWIGDVTREFKCQYNYEATKFDTTNQIIFTGVKAVPQNYFQLFDVFALTSREESFGLVAIEAAILNKPVLCFNDSGGIMPELIENEKNGIIIPYGDVKEMAKKILELMDDNNKRIKMGEEACKLIENFDVDIAGKQIVQLIDQLIQS